VDQAGASENDRLNRYTPIFALGAFAIWLLASLANTVTFWTAGGFRAGTIALVVCAGVFGFLYLPAVAIAAYVKRRRKRAASALGGLMVFVGSFYLSPLDPMAFGTGYWRLALNRDAFMGEVERARADEPHVLGFFWGATGGAFSRTLVYWLVYDESGEIARPPDARSAAWKERAARTIPFFANPTGCRGEKQVRHLDGHFHVLVLWC